jgi:hypothetical protein
MGKRPIMIMTRGRLHAVTRALPTALALAALAAAPTSAAALASAPGAFTLSPAGTTSSISLHGAPGRTLRGAVLLRNLSRHPITVILQRADIRNASNGNADYVTTHLSGTGRWLRLSAGRVRLASHALRQVTYSVRIPHAAAGGSHYGGIVAVNAADFSKAAARGHAGGRAFSFHIVTRQALPLTIHLPGRLSRSLALRSVKLVIAPIGAGLVLGLHPGGSELIERAQVRLRALRGRHVTFTSSSTLGQLFPGGSLNYRLPWPGRPRAGTYDIVGTIRPQGSAVIYVNRTIRFTGTPASRLVRDTAPATQQVPVSTPTRASTGTAEWMWIVLGMAAILLIALPTAVWKLARRPVEPRTSR